MRPGSSMISRLVIEDRTVGLLRNSFIRFSCTLIDLDDEKRVLGVSNAIAPNLHIAVRFSTQQFPLLVSEQDDVSLIFYAF